MEVISFVNILPVFACLLCISLIKADFPIINEIIPCIGKLNTENINPETNILTRAYSPLLFKNFDKLPDGIVLQNSGLTININLTYSGESVIPTISEGPLKGKGFYRLQYLYFNWIENIPEDWKPGDVYLSAELHLVFYSTKIGDYETALAQNNAIAIMSFMFEKPNIRNETEYGGLEIVANSLKDISHGYKNTSLDKSQLFTLNDLLPIKSGKFQYTYTGTMINEVCSQDVLWLDFEERLPITEEEIYQYRKLTTYYTVSMSEHFSRYRQPSVVYRNIATRFLLDINVKFLILVMACLIFN